MRLTSDNAQLARVLWNFWFPDNRFISVATAIDK